MLFRLAAQPEPPVVNYFCSSTNCSKKNLNVSRPSEHPTQGGKCQNAVVTDSIINS